MAYGASAGDSRVPGGSHDVGGKIPSGRVTLRAWSVCGNVVRWLSAAGHVGREGGGGCMTSIAITARRVALIESRRSRVAGSAGATRNHSLVRG